MGSYFGSKATSGLCQPIIALMPPHDTYIETHLGGGAIMKRKPPALHNIGIDLNPRALAAFECDYPVKKVNDCAHRFLAEYDYGGRELIYSDPPYLHHTRTSGRRYRFDYEEQDHIELLELLKTLPCNVILSGYPSALYDERLAGWRTLNFTDRQRIRRRAANWGKNYRALPRAGTPRGAGGHDGGRGRGRGRIRVRHRSWPPSTNNRCARSSTR